jgi:type IV secretory pathway TrbD component
MVALGFMGSLFYFALFGLIMWAKCRGRKKLVR